VSDFSDAERHHHEAVNSCTPTSGVGPYFAATDSHPSKKDSTMQADTAVTAELPKLNLPQDLLTEVKRGGPKARTDFGVDGLSKPSLIGRFMEKLLGSGKSSK
jgi:hypothetical protein